METSPTASGKGLRQLVQCMWLGGCDVRVVMFLDSVVMWKIPVRLIVVSSIKIHKASHGLGLMG